MNESPIFTAPCCTFFGRRAMSLELSKLSSHAFFLTEGPNIPLTHVSEVYVSRDFPIS